MKKSALVLLILIGMVIVGCQTNESPATVTPEPATSTEVPTDAPAVEPTEEATIEVEAPEPGALQANPWQWTSFNSPVEQFDVDGPESYLLVFNDDGTLNVVADCNLASGSYEADGSSLTIQMGPMTLAACPEGSRSDQFVQFLGGAAIYFFEDGNLHIDLMADGGTMVFAPADPALLADDGEGAIVGALQAYPWQWEYTTTPVEQFDVDSPESYLVTFDEDGTVNIKADCNNAIGSYTDDAGALTITLGPMTLAACPEGSRSDQFLAYLASAARYFIEDSNLYIDMMADGGTMAFAPAGDEAMADDGEGAMAGTLPEEIVAQLDALLQSQVYREGGHPQGAAPGLVLLVDTPDGRYLNAAGVANLDDGTPIQVDDRFEIGSNTKSMTIVVLMQLVEEGVLSLDDSLSQWLPEQADMLPNGDQITLRQMALHTAGLWDYADDVIGAGFSDPAAFEQGYTPEELVQYAADNGEPYFAPGEEGQWYYSNTGYILLGMILEKATGESLADLYQTRIFDPLGLESAILIEGVPEPGQVATQGYYWEPSTKDGQKFNVTNANLSQAWAAGAVAMTAEDLATYGHALAAGELFQNPDTLDEMLAFNPDAATGLGPYGLGLLDFAGDGTVWGHAGETLGWQSIWFTDPENEILVVGWADAGSYKIYSLLNVLNILNGSGAQPITGFTLLPVGEIAPSRWSWTQFINPAESMDIEQSAGTRININKDQTVLVVHPDCGLAAGTYTVDGTGQIDFELDDSNVTCAADSLFGQFIQHLQDAARWHFDNGDLVLELPADGGSLIFDFVPPGS
jgi:D-alanyl-D-alanine carboxypeptidase